MKTLLTILITIILAVSANAQVYYSSEFRDNQNFLTDLKCRHSFVNGYYVRSVFSSEYRFLYSKEPQKIFSTETQKDAIVYFFYNLKIYVKPREVIEIYDTGLINRFKRDE